MIQTGIDAVARGSGSPEEIRAAIEELIDLAPERARSYFHLGLAQAMLDEDLFERSIDDLDPGLRRWAIFGRLIGFSRRRQHARLADLLHRSDVTQLLDEAAMARSILPILLRTAFADGDLDLALSALERLVEGSTAHHDALREVLGEILRRVERSRERAEEEALRDLLVRCRDLPAFARLPDDIRVPIHRSIGRIHQHLTDWEPAREQFARCLEIAGEGHTLASVLHFDLAACHLHIRGVPDLVPDEERPDCQAAMEELDRATAEPRFASFNAYFTRGILHYEKGRHDLAAADFEHALEKISSYRNPLPVTLARIRFYLGVSLLVAGQAAGKSEDARRAARLIDQGLERVHPDSGTFDLLRGPLGAVDPAVALRLLDAIELDPVRASARFIDLAEAALDLGDARRAARLAEDLLESTAEPEACRRALDLQLRCAVRLERRAHAREVYAELRDSLLSGGAFAQLESLLRDDGRVGWVLDHFTRQAELQQVLELMEDRTAQRVDVLMNLARHLRARKDAASLIAALELLEEAVVLDPERCGGDLEETRALAEHAGARRLAPAEAHELADRARRLLGHDPRIVVLGGGEAQRREIDRFERLRADLELEGGWWLGEGRGIDQLLERFEADTKDGLFDAVVLPHWIRGEARRSIRNGCRARRIACRAVDYVGFVSLEVAICELLEKLIAGREPPPGGAD